MGAPVSTAYKATVTFATSTITYQIVDIQIPGITRESIDVTHQQSAEPGASEYGGREFIPFDLADPGQIVCTVNHDPDKVPPVKGEPEQITVGFKATGGDTTGATWVGNGFVESYDISHNLGEKQEATMTIKKSGAWAVTAGSA